MGTIDPKRHFEGANLKTVAKLKILDWYLVEYVNIMEKTGTNTGTWTPTPVPVGHRPTRAYLCPD